MDGHLLESSATTLHVVHLFPDNGMHQIAPDA